MVDFYVYVHRKAATGEIFYVGKGKDDRAWDSKYDRSKHWNYVVNKHGLIVEIIQSGLREWYAFELEIELIALYGRKDLNLGTLINKTDGGEGVAGYVYTEEALRKLSESHIGFKHSAETRAAMSASMTPGRRAHLSSIHTGVKLPEERVKNMSGAALEVWSRPGMREKISKSISLAYESTGARQKLSEAAKQSCSTPEARAVKSAVARAAWADPEHKARVSAIQKQRWAERKARASI